MQSILHIQYTFLEKSRSTTAGHLPHSSLDLRHTGTKNFVSQLEAHLQAALVEQLPENYHIA
jgi:hypothetical protein